MPQTQEVKFSHPLLELNLTVTTTLSSEEFDLEAWASWLEKAFSEKIMTDPKYHVAPSMTYEEWKESHC